jgi:murein DD-endopeptidase MepM/ murein hydrolase activator NlpD
VAASGIGLAWTGDLRLVTTERAGVAAEASASPAQSLVALAVPTSTPTATPTATLIATVEPTSVAASAASPEPVLTPAPTIPPDGPVASTVTGIADLPPAPDRRRAQTWEAPADPARLDGYRWPLPKGLITDPFGPSPWGSRVVDGQLFHDGLDIATFCGDRIVAAHDGVVLAAGRRFDDNIGWVGDLSAYYARLDAKSLWFTLPITVIIDDGNGYRSIYAHFYQVVVKPGQRVKAGQFLGYEGATGRATGCHLHYGLFAPHETATMAIEPSVVEHLLVPAFQIARIDPLLVLPRRPGDEEPTILQRPHAGHGLGE